MLTASSNCSVLAELGELLAVARAAHPRHVLEGDRARAFGAADLDHRAQLRQPRRVQFARLRCRKLRQQRVQHLHVVGGLERGRGDDRRAADLGEREFEFAQAIGGIDGDENEPGLGGGKLRQRPFRPVQRPDADPRAALEAEREKARGQRIDAFGKFLPGPAHVMARRNQRLAIAPALRGLIEAAPDGVAEQRRVGDAADVAVGVVGQDRASPCVCELRTGSAMLAIVIARTASDEAIHLPARSDGSPLARKTARQCALRRLLLPASSPA